MKEKITQGKQIELVFYLADKEELTTKEIYEALPNIPKPSIRRALRHDKLNRFKAIARGLYILDNGISKALLIEGNGRDLSCLNDGEVSAIITDHPWDDKLANNGGNRQFATYECFQYEQRDFDEKARVLRDGGYLVEFLPYELASNVDYLYRLKKMAEKAGFRYYACILGKKVKVSNTGRVKKCLDQICIFSKGKPRVLNSGCENGKALAYSSKEMLEQIFEYDTKPIYHKAEKPVSIYRYLIEMFTHVGELVVDQFAGAGNIIQAALDVGRYAIAIEKNHDTVVEIAKRFGMNVLKMSQFTAAM